MGRDATRPSPAPNSNPTPNRHPNRNPDPDPNQVGRDATRAFCTGCLEEACLIASLHGLTEAQAREADRWVELYDHHDKYHLVGLLHEYVTASTARRPPAHPPTPTRKPYLF